MKDQLAKLQTFVFKYAVILLVCWTLIIFILCSTPGQYIPSADWLELLSFDKFVHATMFFILTALFFATAIKYNKSQITFIIYFFLAVCYGGSLELMQAYWFSNRSADWKDIVANTFGCIVAVLFLKKIKKVYSELI